ncbi:unnamed protein product [Ectocarpus sp. 13 AM-2016]
MEKTKGWEQLGELSKILQAFRRMYVHREAEDNHPAFPHWRQELVDFLKGLLLSCEVGTREDGDWIHFSFEGPFATVLGHSCCDWSSPDAFGCGLMPEVVQALLQQVQSELPVCTPVIVHVLLHRLAVVRPVKEASCRCTNGPFLALVSGLQGALDACPAMPTLTLETSIEDCLRRPSPGTAAWAFGSTRMFVSGVLSLVSSSPRSLCQAVVSVLVRFVAGDGCDTLDDSLALDAEGEEAQDTRRRSRCLSCSAALSDIAAGIDASETEGARPQCCSAQEKRDVVLESMLRWAVDVHFRQCSRLLQASVNRAVCDGVRQALVAAELSRRQASPPSFPPGCRLLLSFIGGLAGDGGAQIAGFLRELCGAEMRRFLARGRSKPSSRTGRGRRYADTYKAMGRGAVARRQPEFPTLEAYVGHLSLCRHVSDPLSATHLVWLARQALAVLRMLDMPEEGAPGTTAAPERQQSSTFAAVLASLSHALALLLTRPKRGGGCSSTVRGTAGNLLEIVFDSDARPLSCLPRPLAEAAIDVLKEAGHLRLARSNELLRPQRGSRREPNAAGRRKESKLGPVAATVTEEGASFASGIDFQGASLAFRNSWSLAAAGVDTQLPSTSRSDRSRRGDGGGDSSDNTDSGDDDDDSADGDVDGAGAIAGNGWGRVPDEVTLRVFSFMTPKRVCRLACVDRAWRELLMVSDVWRPFFEARWPLTAIGSDLDLAGVSDRLLAEGLGSARKNAKRRRRHGKIGVVHWRTPEDTSEQQQPLLERDWMALYRDRHRAERAARGKFAAKTEFPWLVCPFLGCVSSLKSEFAVKRHVRTHKRPRKKRRIGKKA